VYSVFKAFEIVTYDACFMSFRWPFDPTEIPTGFPVKGWIRWIIFEYHGVLVLLVHDALVKAAMLATRKIDGKSDNGPFAI
jgi:hypothetical protein